MKIFPVLRLVVLLVLQVRMTNLHDVIHSVKREDFFSPAFIEEIRNKGGYKDTRIPIGHGQHATKPSIVHNMVELLVEGLDNFDSVFEIGTGSGYQTAILSKLFKKVYTAEIYPSIAKEAKARLAGYTNIHYIVGNGQKFSGKVNGIIAGTCLPTIPECFDCDCMVLPVGNGNTQEILRVVKTGEGSEKTFHGSCGFVLAK